MKRLCLVYAMALSASAFGAEVTRVASSFEEKDPFGMFLDFTFDRTQEQGVIVREWYQGGQTQDFAELKYAKAETKLGIDVNLGVYKDFEIHFGVPIVFQQDRDWTFAGATNESNTTIYKGCAADASGGGCATPGSGNNHLFEVPQSSYRSGLGDFTFGIAWNAFVQKKDPSKPTWTLRFDYTAPTASVLNPSIATSASARGAIGDRIHRYTFSTALSKKLNSWLEPYFEAHYTLPWRGPGAYSNCDDPSPARLSFPQNCGQNGWTREVTGIRPAHVGGVLFGTELTVFERSDRHQRVMFDVRGFFTYVSESRSYNEMSDLFGKLLHSSDYAQLGAQLGFVGQAAEFIKLRASGAFAYNTERFLTNEVVGKSADGNRQIDVSAQSQEVNPNYDFRIDNPGRRFRMQQQYIVRIQVTATFNF